MSLASATRKTQALVLLKNIGPGCLSRFQEHAAKVVMEGD
jgi:hypothetical protein